MVVATVGAEVSSAISEEKRGPTVRAIGEGAMKAEVWDAAKATLRTTAENFILIGDVYRMELLVYRIDYRIRLYSFGVAVVFSMTDGWMGSSLVLEHGRGMEFFSMQNTVVFARPAGSKIFHHTSHDPSY